MITIDDFTRINNDTNGNPRYVCHFLAFNKPDDLADYRSEEHTSELQSH